MSMIRPIWHRGSVHVPSRMKAKAPKTAMGVPRSTPKGSDQLSYWAAKDQEDEEQ